MSRRAGILTFTACALQASAFLLPPNVAVTSDDASSAWGIPSTVSTTNAVVQLPCSECVFSASQPTEKVENIEDEPLFWTQGGANSVLVNFTLSDDRQRLQVNGETIYPLGLLEADMFGSPKVYVHQVRSGVSLADIEAGTDKATPVEVTGHSISIRQPVDDEALLIPIEYAIFELNHQPVSLDVVTVNVLDLPEGLMIASAVSEASRAPRPEDSFMPPPEDWMFPSPPSEWDEPEMDRPHHDRQKECNMLPAPLCKLRNIIESKLMGLGKKGGCHGRKGGRPHGGKLPTHIKGPFFRPDADDREPPPHHGHHFGPDMDGEEPPHHGHRFRPDMDGEEPPHHGHRFRPEMDDEEPPHRPFHHGRPHRPHHHGRHGHHGHHFMHAFSRGLAAVLVPTMASTLR